MEKNMLRKYLILLSMAGIALLSACKTEEDFRRERAEKAVRYFEVSKFRDRELTGNVTLNLKQCVETALAHNLDIKVYHQEEDIASEMRTAELLGMLPEINFNDHFSGRSNTPASGSRSYKGEGLTYGATRSQDRVSNLFNIDFALSIMDFGLAFFNSQQAQDRVILRKQRTERMVQNLTMDVIHAYCKVAAAQRAVSITRDLLHACRNRIAMIERLARKRQITPFRAFEETRKFNEMERALTAYEVEYHNACVELRSLLGYYPSANIRVDDSFLDKTPGAKLPDLEVLEQIALIKRPELRSIEVERHINIVECRKAILSMFPTARIFLDYNVSSNDYLYNRSWWELGINAAFNLLKLPQKVARAVAYDKQADVDLMRVYGQSIAVIAQVRMAHADIRANQELYTENAKIYKHYSNTLSDAQKTRHLAKGDMSHFEIDHMKMTTAKADIEKNLALANYYVSFYRLMNAVGLSDYSSDALRDLPEELKILRSQAEKKIAGSEKK